MKLASLTALVFPVASVTATGESYVPKMVRDSFFGVDQPVTETSCTYYSVGNDEGCAPDELCKIGTGDCRLMIAFQDGVCYAPSPVCTADWSPVCGCDNISYSNECTALGSGVNIQNEGCCPGDEECEGSESGNDDEPTPCTYYGHGNEEGCAPDELCLIGTGDCRSSTTSHEGVCYTPSPVCTFDWSPVCGCDNISYANECTALAYGVNIQNDGCCPGDEECEGSESGGDEPTPCTYYSHGNEEGCAPDEMCEIGTGECMLRSAFQEGVCSTPPVACSYILDPVCGCDGVSYASECVALGAGVNVQYAGCCNGDKNCVQARSE